MAEKVIFEFRAESNEKRIRYKYRRGDGDYKVLNPPRRSYHPPMLFCPVPWVRGPWISRRRRDKTRRRMRATLDFYEQMYDELYGESDVDKTTQDK